jgi:hypothetical protein
LLRCAKLVRGERRGRERLYFVEPERLVEARDWLMPFERYWRQPLHALDDSPDEETR